MMYVGLRKELPRPKRRVATVKKTTKSSVVTISLINPPLCYRTSTTAKPKVIKIFC